MKIGIMQPYFLPYIGYFQLMANVDFFVIYDNIQYTKKGWINRNRILFENEDVFVTLPLKKGSDYLNINERYLADDVKKEIDKIKRKIHMSYSKAPYYNDFIPLINEILDYKERNLFKFILNSIKKLNNYLEIEVEIISSSTLNFNIEEFKGQDKVLEICKSLRAKTYINPIGGLELYNDEKFKAQGIDLLFIKSDPLEYNQFNKNFVPWLSIIDVIMFNGKQKTQLLLKEGFKYESN